MHTRARVVLAVWLRDSPFVDQSLGQTVRVRVRVHVQERVRVLVQIRVRCKDVTTPIHILAVFV